MQKKFLSCAINYMINITILPCLPEESGAKRPVADSHALHPDT